MSFNALKHGVVSAKNEDLSWGNSEFSVHIPMVFLYHLSHLPKYQENLS